MIKTNDHPREFQVLEHEDYYTFWEYGERRTFAREAARQLRNGVSLAVNLEPGDMTSYKTILTPIREHSHGVASYCRESFLDDDSTVANSLIVRLMNCGEGWAALRVIDRTTRITARDLEGIAPDRMEIIQRSTRTAIAGMLEAIRLADVAMRTDR